MLLCFGLSACYTPRHHMKRKQKGKTEKTMPPGQAKKVYGEKSAKKFAPGHRK